MSNVIVSKLPIGLLVGYFVAYVVIHFLIGQFLKIARKELAGNPGDSNIISVEKWTAILFKWFPMIYVIFLLIILL